MDGWMDELINDWIDGWIMDRIKTHELPMI